MCAAVAGGSSQNFLEVFLLPVFKGFALYSAGFVRPSFSASIPEEQEEESARAAAQLMQLQGIWDVSQPFSRVCFEAGLVIKG